MNCLLGILHYFDQAIHTYHQIPDIVRIDFDMADLSGKQYQASLRTKVEDKEEIVTKFPDLTVANNWCDFKEKFVMNLVLLKVHTESQSTMWLIPRFEMLQEPIRLNSN